MEVTSGEDDGPTAGGDCSGNHLTDATGTIDDYLRPLAPHAKDVTVRAIMMNVPGRPKSTAVDVALIQAAQDILMETGYEGLSVHGLVKRAGTTRPTFYRRYPDLGALALEILLSRYAVELDEVFDTGDLSSDLLAVQRDQLIFFTESLVYRALPGFFAALRADDKLRRSFFDRFLAPRRQSTALILRRAMRRQEIPGNFDVDWICDLLTGPFILRVQIPEAGPLDDNLVYAIVAAALAALGYRGVDYEPETCVREP